MPLIPDQGWYSMISDAGGIRPVNQADYHDRGCDSFQTTGAPIYIRIREVT
jgi:hypothetical protein